MTAPHLDRLARCIKQGLPARCPILTAAAGPVSAAPVVDAPPTASGVGISGNPTVGIPIHGSYLYNDAENNPEGTSTYQWMIDSAPASARPSGPSTRAVTALAAIPGAVAQSYTPAAADQGHLLFFCVTPVANSGTTLGAETCSTASTPVAAAPGTSIAAVPTTSPTGIALLSALLGLYGLIARQRARRD